MSSMTDLLARPARHGQRPAEQEPGGTPVRPRRIPGWPAWVVAAVLGVGYLAYVWHYSLNVIFWDDWGVVPTINASLHGSLSFSMLWVQHNENRMLFPNLVFVAFGHLDRFNTHAIVVLSALVFYVTFVFFVLSFGRYARRPLGVAGVALFGLVWFSLEDIENALWSFQLAWYMVVFCLLAVILLLAVPRVGVWRLAAAIALCFVGSYSSLQGLALWLVGLVCLLWPGEQVRRPKWALVAWIASAITCTVFYCLNFNFSEAGTGGGSVSYALHHPVRMLEYFVASVGNVFPTQNTDVGLHELLGSLLALAALVVVVREWRQRHQPSLCPLPVALICFAVCFDVMTSVGRLSFGVSEALSTRYTIANLLILLAIASHLWARTGLRGRHRSRQGLRLGAVAMGLAALVLAVQVGVSLPYGITNATTWREQRVDTARTLVNLPRATPAQAQALVATYVYPNVAQGLPWIAEARRDRLSVFSAGAERWFEREGLPPTP